jgi:hypothetical protein
MTGIREHGSEFSLLINVVYLGDRTKPFSKAISAQSASSAYSRQFQCLLFSLTSSTSC